MTRAQNIYRRKKKIKDKIIIIPYVISKRERILSEIEKVLTELSIHVSHTND